MTPGGKGCPVRRYRRGSVLKDTWRLVAERFRQAIWNVISPGGLGVVPSDNAIAEWLFALDVHGLQCFGDTLKIDLLECSLSCGSE